MGTRKWQILKRTASGSHILVPRWLAYFTGGTVECVPPCRVYNAAADDTLRQFRSEMDALRKEIRSLKRKLVKP